MHIAIAQMTESHGGVFPFHTAFTTTSKSPMVQTATSSPCRADGPQAPPPDTDNMTA